MKGSIPSISIYKTTYKYIKYIINIFNTIKYIYFIE